MNSVMRKDPSTPEQVAWQMVMTKLDFMSASVRPTPRMPVVPFGRTGITKEEAC